MKPFLSIVKLTCKSAIRSHIFQLLLALLVFCVVLLPISIAGDGTAWGFIQISLKYSLSTIGFIISMSAIWLSCYIMSRDTESYQLHMVVSKPVSRIVIWLGKFTGVLFIHLILLLIASMAVYFIVIAQFYRQGFSDTDKKRIENEVMVGRRVYYPQAVNWLEEARFELQKRIAIARKNGTNIDTSPSTTETMLKAIRAELIGRSTEVLPGYQRGWEYNNMPHGIKQPVFLRYRVYVNKISTENQRMTRGMWFVIVPTEDKSDQNDDVSVKKVEKDKQQKKYISYTVPLSQYPEQFMTGVFHEKKLGPQIISPFGQVRLMFANADPERKSLHFQPSDGPKLLIKVTGFTENYLRAVLVIFMWVALLTGLGCAAAAILSMPTAIFLVMSYLMFGSVATFMVSSGMGKDVATALGYYVSKILLWTVIPMQNFEVTYFVARGELIEWNFIGTLFLNYFILRGVPLFLLGIYLYWRRELGLVIRK
jgi:hypothetical protein